MGDALPPVATINHIYKKENKMNAERNYKIAEMEYEELLRLDNKILTESELEELQEHELVTYWET